MVLAGVLCAAPARADTLGYLRTTPIAAEFTIAEPSGAARVVVARTQREWQEAWKAAGGSGPAKPIDFDRQMIVGVVNGAKHDRVVYRIQLDDAASPKALEVHLGSGDAPTWSGNTRRPTGAHFVVTPRSALAVHFVMDEMVDGRVFGLTNTGEGVESKAVATVAAVVLKRTGKAQLREDAERAVVSSLSAADRKKLLVGPMGAPLKRIPHGWTKLLVLREQDRWSITYDDLTFHVDAATGHVTKVGP
jgi:hypothetical protein